MISHIIFDFGNVLIELHQQKCIDKLVEHCGYLSENELYRDFLDIFISYETGKISDEHIIWRFQQRNPNLNPNEFVKAWNSMLGDIHVDTLSMLEVLSKKYTLSILSNINPFHARHIDYHIRKEHSLHSFFDYFQYVFYSHQVKMRKPDLALYNHVQKTLEVEASKILFIDDMVENVEAAISCGWNAVQHMPNDKIYSKIEDYINFIR